jgi:hypothetical protein
MSDIERLRSGAAGYTKGISPDAKSKPTLTDAEREAIECCLEMATIHATECEDELATLRNLLVRLA